MKREFEVFNEHRVFELKLFAFQDNISGVSAVYEEMFSNRPALPNMCKQQRAASL